MSSERDLRANLKYRDIPIDEWESIVRDPRSTRGRHSLFKQTKQQYWTMKNLVAQAMTLHQEHDHVVGEETEAHNQNKEKDPIRVKLLREIATI